MFKRTHCSGNGTGQGANREAELVIGAKVVKADRGRQGQRSWCRYTVIESKGLFQGYEFEQVILGWCA